MKYFLTELKLRNKLLYIFGWYNLICGILCLIAAQIDEVQILGISRWIKPMKFFFSVWIMVWTMGWLMYYLKAIHSVKICSWLITIFMFIENFIISIQSFRGVTSHFNNTTAPNIILFAIMGIAILLFTFTIVYVTILFFLQKEFSISGAYLWGIRFGILLFLFFSVEGGMMLSNAGHTVGAADGGPGLPLVNWSTKYGDLRIAHFFGMHALQIIPLASYYLTRSKMQVFIFSAIYFIAVFLLFLQAFNKMPLLQ